MKELVSIIVPVYNGEKTLRRCIDSLLDQTYSPIEILLIDDGSTDLSPQICEEYALKDERVRVFHKPNGGECSARNYGLDRVNGSWITFCDQDDFVGRTYVFSFFYRGSMQKDCLYITGEREGFTEKDLKQVRHIHYSGDITQEMLDKEQKNAVNWGKLYNRKVINRIKLRFNENVFYGGDKLFTMQYLKEMKEVAFNRKYFPYNYINDFNPRKYMRSFEQQWVNYRTFVDTLKLTWPENYNASWFFVLFKLLVYNTLYENVSKQQKIRNLQKIRDDKDTKDILEELIKQGGKTKFLWQWFLKRNYFSVIRFGSPIVKFVCKVFDSQSPIWLKKLLKNIG